MSATRPTSPDRPEDAPSNSRPFERCYLKIRQQEGRLYRDVEVKKLPYASTGNPHYREWQLRAKSWERLKKHLTKQRPAPVRLLDLGCGNGWVTARIARLPGWEQTHLTGMEINREELTQAKRLFALPNVQWRIADIFDENAFAPASLDCILVNSVIQYFPDLPVLLGRLLEVLRAGGEIHLLDSPVYERSTIAAARQRSHDYYSKMGTAEMAAFYYHHCWDDLQPFHPKVLYDPRAFGNRLRQWLGRSDSPFPWIVIEKPVND